MGNHVEDINKLLDKFQDCQLAVEEKKLVVERFLQNLQMTGDGTNGFIKDSRLIGIGSSYENTVVNPKADFDIAVVLPFPFTVGYFECVKVEEPGLYKLKFKSGSTRELRFATQDGYFHIETFRDKIYDELSSALNIMMIFEEYAIEYTRLSSSFCVKLKSRHDLIKLDIVPQIEARVNDIPGWKGKHLPRVIQDYIKNNDMHILFTLSCPPNFKYARFKPLVVQPSFNLLEKEAMLSSDTLRYSVSIAKLVYKRYRWARRGLRSFHIKRVALQLYSKIEDSKNSWFGYILIMEELIKMLEMGKVDGGFIENQNIVCIDKFSCHRLANEVKQVYRGIIPAHILHFFEYPGVAIYQRSSDFTTDILLNIPSFREDDSYSWFELLEERFAEHGIASDEAKFNYAFFALPQKLLKDIPGMVIANSKFSFLKRCVISLCEGSTLVNFDDMISTLSIQDQPPTYQEEIPYTVVDVETHADLDRESLRSQSDTEPLFDDDDSSVDCCFCSCFKSLMKWLVT